jgi:hypothetical protein
MLVKTRAHNGSGDLPRTHVGDKSAGPIFKLAELVRSGHLTKDAAYEAAREVARIRGTEGYERVHGARPAAPAARDVSSMWRREGRG